ncbi:saxitoxin and tetrodotoxin-binding protein 1-like [Labrus mixtus]|uniref:saxitoxin and tetrodotoxin-binding protein 1-like n=1 Tax=Labrus mixtus TaxID=508554 RepID=UPI0029C03BF0|nr:saxitoxin and tetrodotoxin-binding protein 1-like [Labrus mixtus]
MTSLKKTMLLLLLLVAAVGTYAAPENCDGLNKTVPAKDLHKIMGDWILVWSVNVENISSSHVELRLHPDNTTISYIERNMFLDSSCTTYNSTVLIPSEQFVMDIVAARKEGHHQDIEKTKVAHGDFKKLATCLGLPQDDSFTYKEARDFCHKKFSPEQA